MKTSRPIERSRPGSSARVGGRLWTVNQEQTPPPWKWEGANETQDRSLSATSLSGHFIAVFIADRRSGG